MFKKLFATSKTNGNGRLVDPSAPLIDLRQVSKAYETPAGDFYALKEISLRVTPGEFIAVIGKSGSGKTTLVNMITGIDKPTSGEVVIDGTAVHTLSEGAMAEWRGRNVGVIFQFFQLLPMLTNIENVMLPMDFLGVSGGQRAWKERALHLLEEVEIAEHAYKLPSEISGGQQQRVAIARALANDPPILVADEPTGNLDQTTARNVFELFDRLVDQGKTIFMVTHDKDLARWVTRTIILSDGDIIDEYYSSAFPVLSEAQLTAVRQQVELRPFAPNQLVLPGGQMPEKVHVVVKGEVELTLRERDGTQIVVARLKEGQYFHEIAFLRGGGAKTAVQAHPGSGAVLAILEQQAFDKVVGPLATRKR